MNTDFQQNINKLLIIFLNNISYQGSVSTINGLLKEKNKYAVAIVIADVLGFVQMNAEQEWREPISRPFPFQVTKNKQIKPVF